MTPRSVLGPFLLAAAVGVFPSCGGYDDDRPATLEYLVPAIIAPNCATSSCHNSSSAVAGLDLSTPDHAYRSFLTLKVPEQGAIKTPANQARPLVTPFNPTASRVVTMLRADGTKRMPPDRPLAEADIELIERWILLGAARP